MQEQSVVGVVFFFFFDILFEYKVTKRYFRGKQWPAGPFPTGSSSSYVPRLGCWCPCAVTLVAVGKASEKEHKYGRARMPSCMCACDVLLMVKLFCSRKNSRTSSSCFVLSLH